MHPTRPVVRPGAFFALTFGLSWLIWLPLTLSHLGIGPFQIAESTSMGVRLLGVLMPATAALLLTAHAGGRAAVRQLLATLAVWRVGWGWWGAAVVVQPLLLLLSALLFNRSGGQPPLAWATSLTISGWIASGVMLTVAVLGEEIGWRGLALPALQRQYSTLPASVLLAFAHATWHLPFWMLQETYDQYGVGYLLLSYLFVFPMTLYINWLFNRSRSSVLLVVACHLAFNLVNVAWLPVTVSLGAFAILIGIECGVALFLLPRLAVAPRQSQSKMAVVQRL